MIAYFVQWGIYQRNYHVKNIVTSGAADKLTILNYAFGNVVNGECIMTTQGASWMRGPIISVATQAAKVWMASATPGTKRCAGNFNQLKLEEAVAIRN